MSVDKQDLIDNEEQVQDDASSPVPPHSAYYDGPAVISVPNPSTSNYVSNRPRSSYTAYPQPSPFDIESPVLTFPTEGVTYPTELLTHSDELNGVDQLANLGEPPRDYTTLSILVAVFCCLPLGIQAFIKAQEAKRLHKDGHEVTANQASQEARRWIRIGIVLGLTLVLPILTTVIILLLVLL